jgi:hypothetical protein
MIRASICYMPTTLGRRTSLPVAVWVCREGRIFSLVSKHLPFRDKPANSSSARKSHFHQLMAGSNSLSITPSKIIWGLFFTSDFVRPVNCCLTLGASCALALFSSLSNCGKRQVRQMLSGVLLIRALKRRYFNPFQTDSKRLTWRLPKDLQ